MSEQHPRTDTAASPAGKEPDREISLFGIGAFVVGLAAVMLVAFVLMWLFYQSLYRAEVAQDPPPSPISEANDPRLPPEPRLQENPEQELIQMRAEEEKILTGFGWVDRRGGTVRIPVREAMELIVEQGPPLWLPSEETPGPEVSVEPQ